MKTRRNAILAAAFLSLAMRAEWPFRSTGSKYFDEAARQSAAGKTTEAAALAEKGWSMVRTAGLADPGFLEGAFTASGIFTGLGQELRAESVFTEAESLCEAPHLQVPRLRLQYMHVDHLIRGSQYVKAEALLRSSLAMENRATRKSSLYVAFLQSLAFVREQEGDLEDAEDLYRATLGYARSDLSGVVAQTFQSSKGPRLPFIGDPRASLAAFYTNHGRIKDAEALYREKLAQPSLGDEERLDAMRQLVSFLSMHGSKSEALQIEAQILELLDAQWSNQLPTERNTLARLEVDVGRPADAKALLEADLERAAQAHGKESAEYRGALNYILENRRYAGDYDAAEAAARERVRLALESGSPEPSDLASALFSLSYVRREQGHLEEAEDLEKRGIAANRAAAPQPVQPGPDRFAAAEALVRAGKADEALSLVQGMADAAALSEPGLQFGFRSLAQLMHSLGQTSAATQLASLALSLDERAHGNDPGFASDLLDWANFYRGFLHQTDRAGDLVTRAETIVLACCGPASTRMEGVLQERAWCVAAASGEAASLTYLEQLRELRASIYGAGSQQVETSTRELAAANARAGRWPEAAKLYLKAVDISARRTAGFGAEHLELLDSVAMEFFHHGDAETALALNRRASEHAAGFADAASLQQNLENHLKVIHGPK